MKIAIATDFHLSYRQYGLEEREQDFYKQYDKLIQAILNEQPDIFITLGDTFDTPYPKPIAIRKYKEGLIKLNKAGIKCYGIVGNHTLIQRRNYYPIDRIFDQHITILNEDSITIDDIYICGLNYHPKSHNIKEKIDHLYEKGKDKRLKILLLHQSLRKDIPIGYDFDEIQLNLYRFDYVFLGHLHKRILRYDEPSNSVIHYPGSLNSCSIIELIDEMNEGRGYTIFDTDNYLLEMKNIKEPRQYKEYNINEEELNESKICEIRDELKGNHEKPIIQFNITGNNIREIYETTHQLEKDTLIMKHKIYPTTDTTEEHETVSFDNDTIIDLVNEKFDEEWQAKLCLDLMELLSSNRIDEAKELADEVYRQQYH